MFWLISYVIRGAICIFHNLYVSIASRAGFMLSLNVARPWVFNTASYFSVCIPILFEAFQRVLEMVQIQILRKMCVKRTFLPSRFPPALQTRPIITTFFSAPSLFPKWVAAPSIYSARENSKTAFRPGEKRKGG
jgi:hypothetical protein